MAWIRCLLRQLVCRHFWLVTRFGDHCQKCGRYRDNSWY